MTAITGISSDTTRLASADNLKKAGDKFESVFTGMMLGAMRKASLADTLFESKALDTFRDMQDQRIAESMAEHAPIGIGKAMTAFLSRSQPDLNGSSPIKVE
ncbi:MAG TPA: rod-binding protein [Sphingomonas sp.]|jgi:flagellar protein FlgJ|uniref:rod-binding protein n=1 Tax=Sphingomonas sp. TaxID=28214 RepID=UPI002EDAEC2C